MQSKGSSCGDVTRTFKLVLRSVFQVICCTGPKKCPAPDKTQSLRSVCLKSTYCECHSCPWMLRLTLPMYITSLLDVSVKLTLVCNLEPDTNNAATSVNAVWFSPNKYLHLQMIRMATFVRPRAAHQDWIYDSLRSNRLMSNIAGPAHKPLAADQTEALIHRQVPNRKAKKIQKTAPHIMNQRWPFESTTSMESGSSAS